MKTLFVTSYYANLWDTKFGGRPSRHEHYLRSFVSIARMNADFVIYTSEKDRPMLEKFLSEHVKTENKIDIITYELESFYLHPLINKNLGGWNKLCPDRCFEVQYLKMFWLREQLTKDYDFVYWIDMGLSHNGLWPKRFSFGSDWYTAQYYFTIFNNNVLNNINKECAEAAKIFAVAIDQVKAPSHGYPDKVYYNFNSDRAGKIHVVGGWFGGMKSSVKLLVDLFVAKAERILNDGKVYSEEQLLSVIATEYPQDFNVKLFDSWYHEDTPEFTNFKSLGKYSFCEVFEQYNHE